METTDTFQPIQTAGDCIGEPKRMVRPKQWSEEAEEAWRLQQAGYKDVIDYQLKRNKNPERWSDDQHQRIKKLEVMLKSGRGEGEKVHYMYFDRAPELKKKEIHTVKLYYR